MTLTGNGALVGQDILSLHAGWPVLLPRTKDGRFVLFGDRRKYIPTATGENRLRALFYVGTLMAQEETAQVEGILVIAMVSHFRWSKSMNVKVGKFLRPEPLLLLSGGDATIRRFGSTLCSKSLMVDVEGVCDQGAHAHTQFTAATKIRKT